MTGDRILVAGGEPDVARLAERNLASRGYEVAVAATGIDALEKAAAARPAVVVLDVGLPGMSGIEVCRQLRGDVATATAMIIMLTARPAAEDLTIGFAAGADDYLAKPFQPAELVLRVETALSRARRLRGVSPLTGLPGSFEIDRQLGRLISEDPQRFALVHADLHHLAAYNRRYGFAAGTRAIIGTGQILRTALLRVGGRPRLLGHVGGDDFVALTRAEAADDVARHAVAAFDDAAGHLHTAADIESGGMEVRGRDGQARRVPLLSLSLGVATSARRRFASAQEAAAVAAEMLVVAKAEPGSAWRVDQRKAPLGERPPQPRSEGTSPDAASAKEYLSSAQVAALLHVSPRTVARWAADGRLPCVLTLGGHRRFHRVDIERAARLL